MRSATHENSGTSHSANCLRPEHSSRAARPLLFGIAPTLCARQAEVRSVQIRGAVLDSTQSPIERATVSIVSGTRVIESTGTGMNGEFFVFIAPGMYRLTQF
jgi:hypothetical protein